MKTFIKIFIAVEFILVITIISLALIDDKKVTGYAVLDSATAEKADFKIFTKAVCEEKAEHVFCRDELFVKCNGNEYSIGSESLNNLVECNNIKLNLSDAMVKGDGIFKKDELRLP